MADYLSEEIRINDSYASKIMAEYPTTADKGAKSKPVIRHRNLLTTTYVNKVLQKISPFDAANEMIPQNCRMVKTYQKGMLFVIEEPPAMRSIRVDMDMYREAEALKATGKWQEFGYENFFNEQPKRPYTFMIATPYVIHILFLGNNYNLQRGRVGFRTKPLLGPGDQIFRPPLLNVSGNLGICYGSEVHRGPRTSMAREVDHVVKTFWGSTFNPDYIDNYNRYENEAGVCDYFTWQYYSHTNPMFIYNVNWIPYEIRIGSIITDMEDRNELNSNTFGYKTLSDLFNRPAPTGKTVKSKSSKIRRRLLYDVCDGWHPSDDICVNVGDAFPFGSKGEIAFIDSYMAVEGSLEPQYIRVIKDNKLSVMKITNKLKGYMTEKVKELRYEAKLELPSEDKRKKKVYISAGDIVQLENLHGNKVYKKVHYIRKAVDDRLEIRLGSEFYFVDAVEWEKVKKVDISNPEINGVKINGKTKYFYVAGRYLPPTPFARISPVKFDEMTAGTNNNLVAKFIGTASYNSGKAYTFNMGNKMTEPKKLFAKKELGELPKAFFIGRGLYSIRDSNDITQTAYKNPNFGVLTPGDCKKYTPYFDIVTKELVSEDGTHFHVESFNAEIDFHIGEKVIVADWKNPLRMLSVRNLQGFKIDRDRQQIFFILEDKHGKLEEELYVDAQVGAIMIGKIRKVSNQVNRTSAGTKIQATKAGIPCFPKKDVNIIVAFIVDTGGEPLVLCSNGCTLWYEDMMENFTRITRKSKKWKDMEHAPLDPSKIKLQAGDIINGSRSYSCSHGYLVTRNKTNRGIRAVPLQYYSDYDDYYTFDKRFSEDVILDCIPNPRYSGPQQTTLGAIRGFPTFHGMFSETHQSHSPYNFINEPGRILNV